MSTVWCVYFCDTEILIGKYKEDVLFSGGCKQLIV